MLAGIQESIQDADFISTLQAAWNTLTFFICLIIDYNLYE